MNLENPKEIGLLTKALDNQSNLENSNLSP